MADEDFKTKEPPVLEIGDEVCRRYFEKWMLSLPDSKPNDVKRMKTIPYVYAWDTARIRWNIWQACWDVTMKYATEVTLNKSHSSSSAQS